MKVDYNSDTSGSLAAVGYGFFTILLVLAILL